jgi:hypothetical protein
MGARRIPPWAWAILVREFGPKHAPTRLVLHSLRTWMNSSGENCFPTMETIAKGTHLSVRAVKGAVDRARRETWIAAQKVPGMRGAYPHNYYVPCIPDWVDLDAFDARRAAEGDRTFAALSDSCIAVSGHADDELHDKPRPKPRARTKPSAPDDKHLVHVIPKPSAPYDRDSVHGVHSKSPSEVSIQVSKELRSGANAPDLSACGDEREKKNPEVRRGRSGYTAANGLKMFAAFLADGRGFSTAFDDTRRLGYPITFEEAKAHLAQQHGAALGQSEAPKRGRPRNQPNLNHDDAA